MLKDKKHLEEEYIMEKFIKKMDIETSYIEKLESPDFEININGKKMGVEITKYSYDKTKQYEQFKSKISYELNEIVRNRYSDDKIEVRLGWNSNIKKVNKSFLIDEILNFIQEKKNIRDFTEEYYDSYDFMEYNFLSDFFSYINIRKNSRIYTTSRVLHNYSYFVDFKSALLESIINKKSEKAKKIYIEKYSVVWLLIVSKGNDFSDSVLIEKFKEYRMNKRDNFNFEKIYFYDFETDSIYSLV